MQITQLDFLAVKKINKLLSLNTVPPLCMLTPQKNLKIRLALPQKGDQRTDSVWWRERNLWRARELVTKATYPMDAHYSTVAS